MLMIYLPLPSPLHNVQLTLKLSSNIIFTSYRRCYVNAIITNIILFRDNESYFISTKLIIVRWNKYLYAFITFIRNIGDIYWTDIYFHFINRNLIYIYIIEYTVLLLCIRYVHRRIYKQWCIRMIKSGYKFMDKYLGNIYTKLCVE